MLDALIQKVSENTIQDFFKSKISSFKPNPEESTLELPEQFSQLTHLGTAQYDDSDELLVFSCRYEGELTQRSSKKKQFEIAKKVLKEDFKDGTIFVFYDDTGNFRFSFIRRQYGDQDEKYTPWRRYTYFVQPHKNNKTFRNRMNTCAFNSLDAIQEAFSVEPLSKEFYKELSHWYFSAIHTVEFPNDREEDPHTLKANAMIRLITRMIFVWFMKQNRLIPDELFDKQKVDKLLNYSDKTGSTYYKAILQNLFFATLNTPREKGRKFVNRQYGIQGFFRYERFIRDKDHFLELMEDIPFLNGGLFENLDQVDVDNKVETRIDCFSDRKVNEERLKVPDALFFGTEEANLDDFLGKGHDKTPITGLIDLLQQYDFTIDENTPYDQEVALDPELLGMVFENLLASYNPETESTARKESGSFYTPREVVDYMVEESLLEYTNRATSEDPEQLKALFKNNDQQPFTEAAQKQNIIEALSRIKVMDPACGSGAFPMGALQKMVHVLGLLDPDNQLWHERQKAIALEDTQKAYDIGDDEERNHRLDAIKKAFEESINDPDYARKLFLIENAMYGVDIQPIAMQIAKLRFFISLLVDQKTDPQRENFGIMALPNLETKFVAANVLLPLPGAANQQTNMSDLYLDPLKKELNRVRHELFNARTTQTKEKKRQRHKEIQEEIGTTLKQHGFPAETAEAISRWKAFDPNFTAEWFDPLWMFGIGEFDVVIGNPPYIQLQKAVPGDDPNKYADLYKDINYQTFERTGDIYALFYERGMELLKTDGLLCYITSNKWMRANYGKSLRKFLANKSPLKLIDLGPGVFDSATVDVNILLVRNHNEKEHPLQGLTLRSRNQISAIKPEEMMALNHLGEKSWIVLKPEEQSIKEKIEAQGTPLKNWDIEINYGIKTGYNPAFIIDGATKDQLIAEDPKSEEIIRPILRGRDIKRYKAEFADKWLITTFPALKLDINEYPAVKRHLEQFLPKIKQAGEVYVNSGGKNEKTRKKTGNKWFETQDQIGYWEEFEKEKVVYREVSESMNACLLSDNYYFNNKLYFIVGEKLGCIAALLNSTLFRKYYLKSANITGGKGVNFINEVTCKYIDIETEKRLKKLVKAIQKKTHNPDITAEEQQIDFMVYKLYDLTYDEVLVVDPEVPFGREAYETGAFLCDDND